jgi:hypothetical protein
MAQLLQRVAKPASAAGTSRWQLMARFQLISWRALPACGYITLTSLRVAICNSAVAAASWLQSLGRALHELPHLLGLYIRRRQACATVNQPNFAKPEMRQPASGCSGYRVTCAADSPGA